MVKRTACIVAKKWIVLGSFTSMLMALTGLFFFHSVIGTIVCCVVSILIFGNLYILTDIHIYDNKVVFIQLNGKKSCFRNSEIKKIVNFRNSIYFILLKNDKMFIAYEELLLNVRVYSKNSFHTGIIATDFLEAEYSSY